MISKNVIIGISVFTLLVIIIVVIVMKKEKFIESSIALPANVHSWSSELQYEPLTTGLMKFIAIHNFSSSQSETVNPIVQIYISGLTPSKTLLITLSLFALVNNYALLQPQLSTPSKSVPPELVTGPSIVISGQGYVNCTFTIKNTLNTNTATLSIINTSMAYNLTPLLLFDKSALPAHGTSDMSILGTNTSTVTVYEIQ